MSSETVYIPNTLATGLNNIGKTEGVEVDQDTLSDIQEWVESVEFDDADMADIHRTREFGEYAVVREHFHGHEDDVTVSTETNLSSIRVSDFLDL